MAKALVSATQLSGAQSARSFGLSASVSAAQILIGERERKFALIFALKKGLCLPICRKKIH